MSDHNTYLSPVGGPKYEYFPPEDERVDADGNPWPEHDYPPVDQGNECHRCGAEADDE
jgi:hypothetical protein